MISECLAVNEQGHLTVSGVDTVALADQYKTPLYVMDEETIRLNLRNLKKAIDESCPSGGLVAFASKACSFKEMYRIVHDEQCGTDVVSCGEMMTALSAGMPADKIFYHGNNKTEEDLELALEKNIGHIVVDNPDELEMLSKLAGEKGKEVRVLLRITPGIDAHTHSFIKTGQIDSKFGFTLETGEALKGAKQAISLPNIILEGLHCHIGSQIFDEEPMKHAAEVMITFMSQIQKETGYVIPVLNLGGGFGVAYTEDDHPKKHYEYMHLIGEKVKEVSETLQFPVPFVVVEPGRSIVGSAGITLYTVGHVKTIPG
ncbi:MAG: diaminopimelate decarboxylase, partial [Clostridia bacterium]|nr:diaminopimelate decarboxylase [Clostridia bacterium]